jgi:hypothetical protein
MTDVLIYWRDYKQNWVRQFAGERASFWHSNAKLLGEQAQQAGFLVAVWQVRQVVENPDDDPAYPAEQYKYRVIAEEAESLNLEPPVPVDHILRPQGRDRAVSIGRFLQGPRKLSDEKVRLLRAAAGPQMAQQWLVGRSKKEE